MASNIEPPIQLHPDLSQRDLVAFINENFRKVSSITSILNTVYPVGSYYINETNSTNPAKLFGFGTWVAVQDKFIVAKGSTYTSTGGSASHSHPLSDNGAAAIGFNDTIFRTRQVTNSYTSTQTKAVSGAVTVASGTGTATAALLGNTDSTTNVPPYQAAYIWKRTA